MLVNPKILRMPHSFYYTGSKYIKRGIFITDLNINNILNTTGVNTFHQDYPELNFVDCYGVIDTPLQFINKFYKLLDKDPRPFVVLFTHIPKTSWWRWHKWGQYYGDGIPLEEYIKDEIGFENGVYVFHIRIIDYTRTVPQIKTHHYNRPNRYKYFWFHQSRKSSIIRTKQSVNIYAGRRRKHEEHTIRTHNPTNAGKATRRRNKVTNRLFKMFKPRLVWNWRKI